MRLLASAVLGVSCLLGLAARAHADNDSTNDLLGPREIAVGEAMRGGATGASAIGLNPAGLPLNRELVFEGGYGYRASDSASIIGASACDSTNVMPGCFFYDYIGSSLELDGMSGKRRTHIGGVALSRQLVPRILIGGAVKYFDVNTDMMGETDSSGFAFDLGATVRLTQMINLGVSAQNLWATEESTQFPRTVGGGIHARPLPILAIGFDARWKIDEDEARARYGGGAELFLRSGSATGFPIRIGGLHDNGTDSTFISGGLGLATMKWGLDVAARREVKGGDELTIIASMRFFGPRLATPGIE
ncbi:MAG: hypothetical protein ACTHU0_02075 [Kofleriaceae bacterium]